MYVSYVLFIKLERPQSRSHC